MHLSELSYKEPGDGLQDTKSVSTAYMSFTSSRVPFSTWQRQQVLQKHPGRKTCHILMNQGTPCWSNTTGNCNKSSSPISPGLQPFSPSKASNKINTAGKRVRQRCHLPSHPNHVIKFCDSGVSPPGTQLILTLSPPLLRCVLGSRNGIRTGFRDSTCPQQRANHYAVIWFVTSAG